MKWKRISFQIFTETTKKGFFVFTKKIQKLNKNLIFKIFQLSLEYFYYRKKFYFNFLIIINHSKSLRKKSPENLSIKSDCVEISTETEEKKLESYKKRTEKVRRKKK